MTDKIELRTLVEYLKSLISDEIQKMGFELKEAEAQKIVQAIMPEIDTLISKRVRQHFMEIADAIKEKFKDSSEEK